MSVKDGTNLSSEEFLRQLKIRDPKAIEKVVRTYTSVLYKGALGLGFDATAGEELVQSVWVTFFDVVQGFEGRSHVRTFLFGILYNKASELRRSYKKFEYSEDPIEAVIDARFAQDGHWLKPPISPEDFMISSQTMSLIEKCLEALPLNQRMAFSLKEIDEQPSTEICNILGVSVTNLGVLLYRARNRLRECIEGKTQTR